LLAHKLGAGSTPLGGKTVYQAEGVAFVRSQNVYNDGLRLADVARISRATHERMSGTHVQAHDILLNITGASIGRCAIVPDDFVEGNVSQHVAIIRLVLKDIRAFVHLSLISPLFQELIEDVQVGVSREGRSMQRLRQFPILLPPLPEQHRIVARVEDLAAVCDRLEAAQAERDRRRDRVVAAALRRLNQGRTADYPTGKICRLDDLLPLATRRDYIKHLRLAILHQAVTGNLATHDPLDEPASELLKRVRAEKGEKLEIVRHSPRTVGLSVPRRWKAATAGDLLTFVTSGSRGWAQHYAREGAIFLRIGNLDYGTTNLDMSDIQHVRPPAGTEGVRTRVNAGDILISITGDTGMIGLVPAGFPEAYINQHIALARPSTHMCHRYLALFFTSPGATAELRRSQRGIKNSLGLEDIRRISVLVPPLAEQHRIVAKVDELMAICDQLEAQLSTAQTTSRRLLEAVLHKALAAA
jgi:type I restriction enzyme, S subunit